MESQKLVLQNNEVDVEEKRQQHQNADEEERKRYISGRMKLHCTLKMVIVRMVTVCMNAETTIQMDNIICEIKEQNQRHEDGVKIRQEINKKTQKQYIRTQKRKNQQHHDMTTKRSTQWA